MNVHIALMNIHMKGRRCPSTARPRQHELRMSLAQSHQMPFIAKEAFLIRLLHVLCAERDPNRRPPSKRHLSLAPAR